MIRYDYVKTRREDIQPYSQRAMGLAMAFMKLYTRVNVLLYRCSGGRLMGRFMGRYDICLVTFTGVRSGRRRDVALIHLPYGEKGEKKLLVASQGGRDVHPVWYRSIKAHPEIEIQFRGERRAYRARQADADEKRALWPHLLSIYPAFDEYQARTDRDIPVFVCEPC
ncbi:MAG: nitroreductase family deazaflavin-dependent oxidoreductase [Proteobacteria bacterium]|nr:nitroreductase family deazaflavin-dependent oxidoreductase [Pseudomonadota bacterium]HQR03823.1 nitroreductase family deazaflavin-dependent oxidoreductase [Rhodocyclaceae bacterium]